MADMDRGLLHRIDLLVVGLEFCCICCYYFVGYYRCFVVGRLILETLMTPSSILCNNIDIGSIIGEE